MSTALAAHGFAAAPLLLLRSRKNAGAASGSCASASNRLSPS